MLSCNAILPSNLTYLPSVLRATLFHQVRWVISDYRGVNGNIWRLEINTKLNLIFIKSYMNVVNMVTMFILNSILLAYSVLTLNLYKGLSLTPKSFFKNIYLFIYFQRWGRKGERQGEKHLYVREALIGSLWPAIQAYASTREWNGPPFALWDCAHSTGRGWKQTFKWRSTANSVHLIRSFMRSTHKRKCLLDTS